MPNRSNARANSRRNRTIGGFGAVIAVSIAVSVGTARKQPKSGTFPQSMIRKSGCRFSEKIMLKQKDRAG
jgi:hypothetical protein